MKTVVKIEKEIDIKKVKVSVSVRYGEEDIPKDFPLRQGDMWNAEIDIDSGVITGWPEGEAGRLGMKVCDEGTYTLIDSDGNEIITLEQDYVPTSLIPGRYGDYIDLQIDGTGKITNWNPSSFEDFFPED